MCWVTSLNPLFRCLRFRSGSVCKMTSHNNTKGDINLKDEDIKAGKDKAIGMYKVVEEYLLANPDVYA
nr:major allergen pru ar 1 [Quercus suber]